MPLNFPTSPTTNDEYSFGGKTWVYNGAGWALKSIPLTTANVNESGNLYYTDARVYANVSNIGYALDADLTTANVSEVTNLYFTNARVYSNVTSIGFAYSNDLNTSNVIEGANLYYTDARVYANVSNIGYALDADLTTANVAEVSNLYFTNARVYANVELIGYASNSYVNTRLDSKANTADLTTANVSEVTNLYFTNTRSRQAISGGTGVSYDTSNGIVSIGQSVGTTDDVTFSNVTVTGNLFVQGNAITFSSNTLIIQDPLIQVGVNPTGDAVDLGFFGHYLDASIEKHAGLFRDATDGQFKLFSNLIAEPTTIVNTANASYQSANLVVNYIVGKITDISNHSTTNLSEGTNLYFTNTRAIQALTSGTGIVIEANGRIFSTVTGDVVSVNGLTGNVTLTTANIAESGNLYFTNTRAIQAFTGGDGIDVAANGLLTVSVTGGVTSVSGGTGDVSNSLILTGLLTVDGSGSGLDADTLDGIESASFVLKTNNLSVLASTTSAELASVISDEVGSGNLVFSTSPTLTTPRLGDGNVLLPALTFTNNTNMGVYREGSNQLGFSVVGTKRANVTPNGVYVVGNLYPSLYVLAGNGAVGSPAYSFVGDSNTGIYNEAADVLGIATNGTKRANVNSNGLHVASNVYATRYFGDGSFLSNITASGGSASVTISNTAPSPATAGDLYWDKDLGKMFIYYNDGTSSQWVESSPTLTSIPVKFSVITRDDVVTIIPTTGYLTVYGRSANANIILN